MEIIVSYYGSSAARFGIGKYPKLPIPRVGEIISFKRHNVYASGSLPIWVECKVEQVYYGYPNKEIIVTAKTTDR